MLRYMHSECQSRTLVIFGKPLQQISAGHSRFDDGTLSASTMKLEGLWLIVMGYSQSWATSEYSIVAYHLGCCSRT